MQSDLVSCKRNRVLGEHLQYPRHWGQIQRGTAFKYSYSIIFTKLLLCGSHDIRNWVQSSKSSGERNISSALELFTEMQKNKQLQNRSGKFNGNDKEGLSTARVAVSSTKSLLNE